MMVRALTMIRSVRLSVVASSFGIGVVAHQHFRVVLQASFSLVRLTFVCSRAILGATALD